MKGGRDSGFGEKEKEREKPTGNVLWREKSLRAAPDRLGYQDLMGVEGEGGGEMGCLKTTRSLRFRRRESRGEKGICEDITVNRSANCKASRKKKSTTMKTRRRGQGARSVRVTPRVGVRLVRRALACEADGVEADGVEATGKGGGGMAQAPPQAFHPYLLPSAR